MAVQAGMVSFKIVKGLNASAEAQNTKVNYIITLIPDYFNSHMPQTFSSAFILSNFPLLKK